MYILTRYVVWEVVKFFAAALVVLTMLFTLVMGVRCSAELGLPPLVLLRTTPLLLPEMFGITIPVAMLYAVSSVFGRMTGSNEIVALKSAGISPMAAIWPVLVLAGFFSLATVWMYEMAATWGRPGVKRVAAESIEEIAYGVLQKSRSYYRRPVLDRGGAGGGPQADSSEDHDQRAPEDHLDRRRGRVAHRLDRPHAADYLPPGRGGSGRANADVFSRRADLERADPRAPPERYHRDQVAMAPSRDCSPN